MYVGVYVLILLIICLFLRGKKQKLLSFRKEEKPLLPPHVRAIQELDAIKNEKLWQRGKYKEYHSQLTDVIRNYIDERFHIYAMEMTSGQILLAIQGISEADAVYSPLKQQLLLSDLVKFAKYHPLPDENELSLMNAYLFVNITTPVQVVEEKENKDGNTN